MVAGRAQTRATNSLASLRLFFTWYMPVIWSSSWNRRCRHRSVARRPSDQGGVRWNASQASGAMVAPHALSNSADATSIVLRPSDSQFERVRCSAGSDEFTHHYPSAVALDAAIASRGRKVVQVSPFRRLRTRHADRGVARRHVVHQHELNRHFSDPCLAPRLRTPAPSFTAGSWFIPASNADLQASLSSAVLSLRQIVISSTFGMNALQSLSTSGVHARRCSSVPCEKQGAGKTVADSKTSDTRHCAKDVSRSSIRLFRHSTFIRGPAIRNRSQYSSELKRIHACRSPCL
jgi:hypothetical protein